MSGQPAKCMKCDKPATHKITKIVKGKVVDLFLCDEHAEQMSPYIKKDNQKNLVHLLHQFLEQQDKFLAEKGPVCPNCGLGYPSYRKTLILGCSDCYQAFDQLLENDLRQYHGVVTHYPDQEVEDFQPFESFPDAAAPLPKEETGEEPDLFSELLKKTAQHLKDRVPPEQAQDLKAIFEKVGMLFQSEILSVDFLKEKLQEAVNREDFDQAARLRDAVQTLEKTLPREETLCPNCNEPMQIMFGAQGLFMACPHFPDCAEIHLLESDEEEPEKEDE